MQSSADLCVQAVRDFDRHRYLALLLMPPKLQRFLFAIHAFDCELRRIPDIVSEAMVGEIRLQWWRDTLSELGGQEASHPIVEELSIAIAALELPLDNFQTMIDGRAFDLYHDPINTRHDFEVYAGETTSLLYRLSALIAGATPSTDLANAAGHAGVALCVADCLRRFRHDAEQGRIYIPSEFVDEAHADRYALLDGRWSKTASAATRLMATFGLDHLEQAEQALAALSGDVRPVFLPLALVKAILRKAQASNTNLFSVGVSPSQVKAQWLLWRASKTHYSAAS